MRRRQSGAVPGIGVDLSHINLQRGGRVVLRDLAWRIRPGERWVLLGANGAGKSQLLKLIAGEVWPQPGPHTRRRYHWQGEWHEQPFGVREEIAYLGAERQDRYARRGLDYRALTVVGTGLQRGDIPMAPLTLAERESCRALLESLGIGALAPRRFLGLSQGEQRLVLLARALAWRPRLLLLDEPLNGLDPRNRRSALAVLDRLEQDGPPWICATHRLDEVPAGATHIARLAGGRLRRSRWRAAPDPAPAPVAARPLRSRPAGAPVFSLQRAAVWRGGTRALRALDWQVRAGECWVVHGPNGSGKSTLLGALHGEHAVIAAGRLWRAGHEPGTPLAQFQQRVGCVSPALQAALPRGASALECVVAGARTAFALDAPARPAELAQARRALRRCGALALAARPFGTLSYGQARRVLFARALVREPDILLLDEPCTGLDRRTRASLLVLLDSPGLQGATLIMATHHLDDWPARTDHELELAGGRLVYVGPRRLRADGAGSAGP